MEECISCNSDSFNSAEFAQFLLGSNLVQAGKEKYMVIWMRRFNDFRANLKGSLSWAEQLPLFLRELKTSGCQDWQVRQADQAVRLYFVNYLKPSLSNRLEKESDISITSAGLDKIRQGSFSERGCGCETIRIVRKRPISAVLRLFFDTVRQGESLKKHSFPPALSVTTLCTWQSISASPLLLRIRHSTACSRFFGWSYTLILAT